MEQTTKACSTCPYTKNIEEFYLHKQKSGKYTRVASCKECHRKDSVARTNTLNGFLIKLLNTAKANAKRRTDDGRDVAGEFSITLKDLQEMYKKQEGKCYYSSLPMSSKILSDYMMSLERLDPSKGYTKENIALICSEFQSACQWTKEKYKEFTNLIMYDSPPNVVSFELSNEPIKERVTVEQSIINGEAFVKCNKCSEVKPIKDFNKCLRSDCIQCREEANKIYRTTPRGSLSILQGHAKARCKKKSNNGRDMKFEIDFDFLVELFHKQKGLCAYSGIPLTFGSHHEIYWTTSLERINPLMGYTKENVCFIIYELNVTDNTARAKEIENVGGTSTWSKAKIEFLKTHIKNLQFIQYTIS